MKKVLIATTALTLSAGIAAAEVKLSGSARFGLQYNGGAAPGASKTSLEKRFTLNLDGSTTADNGVTFGARVRIRSDEGGYAAGTLPPGTTLPAGASIRTFGSAVSGARVFAQYNGLTVAAGNILGAIESMPNVYGPSHGLTGLAYGGLVTNIDRGGATHDAGYFDWDAWSSNGNGAEGIEVIYSMGDFTGHVSYSSSKLNGGAAAAKRLAAYGAYTFSGWTVALAVQDADTARDIQDKVILTASGKIGDFGIGFGVAQNGKGPKGLGGKVTKYALNGSYTMGATTLTGYVATQNVLPVATGSKTSYGIGASYNLGGGARVVGGIDRTTRKDTRADIGVAFNF